MTGGHLSTADALDQVREVIAEALGNPGANPRRVLEQVDADLASFLASREAAEAAERTADTQDTEIRRDADPVVVGDTRPRAFWWPGDFDALGVSRADLAELGTLARRLSHPAHDDDDTWHAQAS
jgi:hypothetical protein